MFFQSSEVKFERKRPQVRDSVKRKNGSLPKNGKTIPTIKKRPEQYLKAAILIFSF